MAPLCFLFDKQITIELGTNEISLGTLQEEMDKMNAIGEKRLFLLGFKPRSSVPLDLHIQTSSFIYPSEKMAKGGFYHDFTA